ncbi:hypothetical protein [Rhizobiales bacterium 3FA27D7]|jgi:hypothetical protein|uniref:hypothetical protein n=1 Tax=Mesorhizobium sp. 2RAF21 TaxID=3232995 RepID=UPI0010F78CBE
MTTPTVLFFGFDEVPTITAKIFLRALLYSTGVRGQVIEGMHAKLRHGNDEQVFGFWGYGEINKLVPGSGLHVGQTGLAVNHHFVRSVHEPAYEFRPGNYTIEICAHLVGKKQPTKLGTFALSLNDKHAAVLAQGGGILFERNPIDHQYVGHARDHRGPA